MALHRRTLETQEKLWQKWMGCRSQLQHRLPKFAESCFLVTKISPRAKSGPTFRLTRWRQVFQNIKMAQFNSIRTAPVDDPAKNGAAEKESE